MGYIRVTTGATVCKFANYGNIIIVIYCQCPNIYIATLSRNARPYHNAITIILGNKGSPFPHADEGICAHTNSIKKLSGYVSVAIVVHIKAATIFSSITACPFGPLPVLGIYILLEKNTSSKYKK